MPRGRYLFLRQRWGAYWISAAVSLVVLALFTASGLTLHSAGSLHAGGLWQGFLGLVAMTGGLLTLTVLVLLMRQFMKREKA